MTLRLVVADDHPLFLGGLRTLLATMSEVELVGEAATGEQAVELAEQLRPDVVVMDLHMPGCGGVEATRQVVERCPATRVLVLTMAEDDAMLRAAVRAGASGYLLKGADADDVLRAVTAVVRGDAVFGPGVAERALRVLAEPAQAQPAFPQLTAREREVLALLGRGMSNGGIARELGLTPKTVQNYVSAVLTKLALPDRTRAALVAQEAGLTG